MAKQAGERGSHQRSSKPNVAALQVASPPTASSEAATRKTEATSGKRLIVPNPPSMRAGEIELERHELPNGDVRYVRKKEPEHENTRMKFDRVEDFTSFLTTIATNVTGHPLLDDTLADSLAKFLKSHFDRAREENPPPIPERKYAPRQDEIISFLREVWSEWLVAGQLTMPILKDADYRAYQALHNWTRKNDLPDDIQVKSASDVTDEFLSRDYYRRDEVYRAASAMGRRGLKNQ